jgi:hypothetical protein
VKDLIFLVPGVVKMFRILFASGKWLKMVYWLQLMFLVYLSLERPAMMMVVG